MPAFALPSDVAELWRPLSVEETARAGYLLARVSAIIRGDVPSIDDRIAIDANLGEIAKGVAVDAVLRVMKNPDGYLEESIDDWSGRRDASTSTGALYISDAELASLTPSLTGLGGAYVVSLGG